MGRVRLPLPGEFLFETEIPVRITDINYGGHAGNDALLSLLQEARVRMLRTRGWTELDAGGAGIIMTDAILVYASQISYGTVLRIRIATADFGGGSCDLLYQVTDADSGRELARAKTGIAFYDYARKKVVPIPGDFPAAFPPGGTAE
ncbi:MAG: thioesterase family protein [Bacteroidota bacterium]